MTKRNEFTVTSGISGDVTVIIMPYQAIHPWVEVGTQFTTPPFYTHNAVNPSQPFNAGEFFSGPFVDQRGDIVTYQVDICSLEFQCTLAPINAAGRFESSFWYEAPGPNWVNATNGALNKSANLHLVDFTNNVGFVKRFTNA